MNKNQLFLALYILLTLVVFITLFTNYGALRAWLFAAVACGIPSVLPTSQK